jgi:photosystem II stability/assembly factor-like uncharacterized protein
MKTKRILTSAFLFYLVTIMTFGQDTYQGSTLINKTNLVISMFDNDFVYKDAQTRITFNEGYHTAELRLYVMSGMLYKNLITSYNIEFTAEKNKTYLVDFIRCNYLDTIDNCYYYKGQYIQVLEKETKKVVGGICHTKIVSSNLDSLNFSHLYDGIILPSTNLSHIVVNDYRFNYFYLSGRSFDGLNITYFYTATDVNMKKMEDLFIKPGYYRLYGSWENAPLIFFSKGTFKAIENRTINYTINGISSQEPLINRSESSLNDVFFLPDGMHGWIVGSGGTILRTTNGGKTWSFISLSPYTNDEAYKKVYKKDSYSDLFKVYFLDSLHGWIAGDKGILFHSTDGGISWSFQNCGNKNTLDALYFKNANDGFAATHLGGTTTWNFLCTKDGGNSWQNLDKSIHPTKYYFLDSNEFYKVISDKLYRSKDCGLTWDVLLEYKVKSGLWTDALNFTISDIFFTDNENGWILKGDSVLYTENDGLTWKSQVWPLVNMKAFSFKDIHTGYAVGNEGKLLLTSDGGKTWRKIESGTMENFNDIEFINNNGWIVGTLGGILITNDGGKNWKYLNLLEFIQN